MVTHIHPSMAGAAAGVPGATTSMHISPIPLQSHFARMGSTYSPQLVHGCNLWHPPTDVVETDENIFVFMDVPGTTKETINVDFVKDELIVSGMHTMPEDLCGEDCQSCNVYVRERRSGGFRKVMRMPAGIDPESVEAKCQNGILQIKASKPKEEQQGGRKISLQG